MSTLECMPRFALLLHLLTIASLVHVDPLSTYYSMPRSWPLEILTNIERDLLATTAQELSPDAVVEALGPREQGYCSYTLFVIRKDGCSTFVMQFRPLQLSIDFCCIEDLTAVYGDYVPRIEHLKTISFGTIGELQISISSLVIGSSYSSLQNKYAGLTCSDVIGQKRVIASFADFISRGWAHTSKQHRAHACNGRVGRTIPQRLALLSQHLPSEGLRSVARSCLQRLQMLSSLPVVLTHGDLLPSNIIINAATNSISGFIDWAEAEHLPFGLCLYGLEHFLGFSAAGDTQFVYYHQVDDLRCHFWLELSKRVPELRDPQVKARVLLARDVGVLLWFGFAWDDGAIDRVINARDDAVELMLLRTFLGTVVSSAAEGSLSDERGLYPRL